MLIRSTMTLHIRNDMYIQDHGFARKPTESELLYNKLFNMNTYFSTEELHIMADSKCPVAVFKLLHKYYEHPEKHYPGLYYAMLNKWPQTRSNMGKLVFSYVQAWMVENNKTPVSDLAITNMRILFSCLFKQ